MYKDKTPEQQKNFKILLDGLVEMYGDKRFDSHFNMSMFQWIDCCGEIEFEDALTSPNCGTSACFLGHGLFFGITPEVCTGWTDYAYLCFGLAQTSLEWKFLFSLGWSNDIQEAIARLKMYIGGFDPDGEIWDYIDRYAKGN